MEDIDPWVSGTPGGRGGTWGPGGLNLQCVGALSQCGQEAEGCVEAVSLSLLSSSARAVM